MASKFNFGERLRVTRHEYRKMDYGAALRRGCSCENRFVSKRWHPSFKRYCHVGCGVLMCPAPGFVSYCDSPDTGHATLREWLFEPVSCHKSLLRASSLRVYYHP